MFTALRTGVYLTTVKPQSHDVHAASCLPVLCFVHEVSPKILSLGPMAAVNINIVDGFLIAARLNHAISGECYVTWKAPLVGCLKLRGGRRV